MHSPPPSFVYVCVCHVCERKEHSLRLICGVEWVCLYVFGICEQLDVFDICVTGHCSSRLTQKLLPRPAVCVCVCMALCLHIRAAKHCHWWKKKYTNTHPLAPFFLNIHRFCHEINFDTNNEYVSSCQFISLLLFPLCFLFVSFSPFSFTLFFPSLYLSQAFKSRLSMNSGCYFVL